MAAEPSLSFSIVTGASSGIGRELAQVAAERGSNLLICSDHTDIEQVATELRGTGVGVEVDVVVADLATHEGVDALVAKALEIGQPIDGLFANAGRGLSKGFLDQDVDDIQSVIDTNVSGTVYLLHRVGNLMRQQGWGRILITGSIAGLMPGTYQAVYNATKAFIDSFSYALRHELKDTGVTVTVLMPGATDTEFFEKANLLDTKIGQAKKDDPAKVAKDGYDAMIRGDGKEVSGVHNKIQAMMTRVLGDDQLATMHEAMAKPGSGKDQQK